MHRREFLSLLAFGAGLITAPHAFAGRKPPSEKVSQYEVLLPDFMNGLVNTGDIDYLNETIPALFDEYRDLFPYLEKPPQYIVLNTLTETLINNGHTIIAADLLGEEALTLTEAQYLLVTMRFGSVATPHRGSNLDNFGKYIYLKQHPQTGYRTPENLLLEEMIHAQQDKTVMRGIIEREQHDPITCLHGQLKGISELGAHYYTDTLAGEEDYVFVLDDGSHHTDAVEAVQSLATKLSTDEHTFLSAITYDGETYAGLDTVAISEYGKHIWEMVTTWRYARDSEGKATDIAPAFMAY